MSFIEDSEQNIVNALKEVSVGTVGGFTGTAGDRIDQLFSGPYNPDYNKIDDLLKKQIEDRKKIRKSNNASNEVVGVESPVGGYYDINTKETEATYNELDRYNQYKLDYSIKNTPAADVEWVEVEKDYDYDGPGEAYTMKVIVYDKNEDRYNKEDFLNTSDINWQYIEGNK